MEGIGVAEMSGDRMFVTDFAGSIYSGCCQNKPAKAGRARRLNLRPVQLKKPPRGQLLGGLLFPRKAEMPVDKAAQASPTRHVLPRGLLASMSYLSNEKLTYDASHKSSGF
jgi:hypothetical protein